MRNCFLCNKTPANKTGSHIVPHFLIKRIDNESGSNGRNKELGFRISQDRTESYFGRAILPEKLEEVYGEITEEIIKKNIIFGIVDNYFCISCEKRLGVVESEYAKTLHKPASIGQNYESEIIPFLGFLFWVSIIWRISILENSGFELKKKEEEKLRRILNLYLVDDIKKINFNEFDSDLNNIGYKIIRSPKYSDEFNTWLHWSAYNQRPYSLIIDEYLVFFYFKTTYLKGMTEEFYGSDKFKTQANFNTPFNPESIFGISHKDYKLILDELINSLARKRIENLISKLDLIHQKLGGKGKNMYPNYKNEILKNIGNSIEVLGRKGTTEEYMKIIINTISEMEKHSR